MTFFATLFSPRVPASARLAAAGLPVSLNQEARTRRPALPRPRAGALRSGRAIARVGAAAAGVVPPAAVAGRQRLGRAAGKRRRGGSGRDGRSLRHRPLAADATGGGSMKKIIIYDHDGTTDYFKKSIPQKITTVKKYNRFNMLICNLYASTKNKKIKVSKNRIP